MIKPPIKWAGGKTRVMPQLLKHLPKADCLIEPFVGSGTVFMNTEYRHYVLCDSNLNLINFFRQLTGRPEDTISACRWVFSGGNNAEEFYKRRAEFNFLTQKADLDPDAALLHAAYFLYLNRHTYNGLYRENLKGEFNSPFGKYAAPYFPENEMRLFAEKANDTNAIFHCGDFRDSIPGTMQLAHDVVIYCDPPTSRPAKPPTSPPTASPSPWTIIAPWLQPCSMLIASMAPARLSPTAIPRKPAKSTPLSISMPSAFAAPLVPKAAIWPVK